MGIFSWADQRMKALNIWDIGVLKIYCALFGMLIGAYVADFVREYVALFVIVVVVLGATLMFRMLTAPPASD